MLHTHQGHHAERTSSLGLPTNNLRFSFSVSDTFIRFDATRILYEAKGIMTLYKVQREAYKEVVVV